MPIVFPIVPPNIPSGDVYYFTTNSGTKYEVRFGRRKDNIFHATIVFGVVNDEYKGEEYVATNKGEIYDVMSTISEIIRIFMSYHTRMMIYEFTAIGKDDEDENIISIRRHLYERYLGDIFGPNWKYEFNGNTVLVRRTR
ncbi:MAG TPA: hypothetical protein VK783_00260 [Bacteroidia bacterium]|jgi:hypothetical protein|nr:hypothetical protein [Bacteroidia bacterium]